MTDLNHETEEGVAVESTQPKGTRWSPSQRGFFDYGYPGDLPGDLLDVTAEEHAALMAQNGHQKIIVPGVDGRPVLADPPVSLEQRRAAAVRKIDADADAIYGAVLGNRGEEYKGAEADAKAYQAAGYAGDVPAGVDSWVAASGMTAQAAADDIVATAHAWRGAMAQIRANRLARKKAVEAAADEAGIDALLAAWADFVAAMRAGLGL
jgi:hypothetical protein